MLYLYLNNKKVQCFGADLNNSIKQEGTTYIEEISIPKEFCNTFDKQKELNIRIWEAIVYTSLYNDSLDAEKQCLHP